MAKLDAEQPRIYDRSATCITIPAPAKNNLLTLQAIAAYVQKLKPGGILMFNLSNRYLDLSDVVGNVAHSLGLLTLVKHHVADAAELPQGIVASTWAVVVNPKQMNPAILQNLQQWQIVQPTDRRLWTDDYSNMISQFTVLKQGFH